ncbi:MAG TPA: DUF4340 domain-containing protein [Polyangiales bacterium]
MNSSRILIALAVLVGLGVAVTTTMRSREAKTTIEAPKVTLSAPKKEDITELVITRPGQPAVTLKKQSDKWRMTTPVDAEPSQSAIDSALERLSELTVTGIAATKKENQERLGVDAAHGIHVVARGGDKPLLDIYIGLAKSGGTMVRAEGGEQVLTAKGSFRYVFDKEVRDFRKREVTELDSAQLTGLTLSSPKGSFKFEKPADAWVQAPGEKPLPKFDHAQVQSVASMACNLRAQDFVPSGESAEVTGLGAPQAKAVLTKKEGGTVEILIGKQTSQGDEYYVKTSESDVVYKIARFAAERLMPEPKYFEKQAAAAPPAQPQAPTTGLGMPALPQGMGGHGMLTPEMMEQLTRQMQQQQMQQQRPQQQQQAK